MRRVGLGNTVSVPKALTEAPPVVTEKKAKQRGFEPGVDTSPMVTLDAHPNHTEAVPQGNVFDVVPQQPQTVTDALAKLDSLDGVDVQTLGDIDGLPVQVVRLKGAPPPPGVEPRRVLLTGGVHGSEPAGTVAAVELVELVAKHPELFPGYEFTVIPLVNPEGFRDNTRQNQNDGVDLNRQAEHDHDTPEEMKLVLPVFDEGPWSLALDLHASGSTRSTGEGGFFAIRTAGNDELLHDVMSEFGAKYALLDQTTQLYTMVEPGVMQSQNSGTVKGYLYEHGTEAAFTLEAPSRESVKLQVDGLVELVQGFLKHAAA